VTRSKSSSAREDAARFVAEASGDDPAMASKLRIEERELDAGGVK
jgi:hypothetical protein